MKTYNIIYKNSIDLNRFVDENNISNCEKVLIQVFCGITDKHYIKGVTRDIKNSIPKGKIIGVTTAGEIYEGRSIEDACILSITVFENTQIDVFIFKREDERDYEYGKNILHNVKSQDTKLILLFVSGENINAETLLSGINQEGSEIITLGGIAANSQGSGKAYVFDEKNIYDRGVVCASLNNKELFVYTDYNFNWVPIGKDHIVTKAEKNIIKEIDYRPAKEFYQKYIGLEEIEDKMLNTVEFPIMVKRNGMYLSRPISGFNEKGELKLLSSQIRTGEKIRLGYGNVNHILECSESIFQKIKHVPIESIFIYSCINRKFLLKSMIDAEIKYLNKDISISGFFTYGEFNHVNHKNMLYTETMVLVGISENEHSRITVDETYLEDFKKLSMNENTALYNLIKTTGDELDELNKSLEKRVEEKIQEIRRQYYTDFLTGLYNRNKLNEDINEMEIYKLALIDINSFAEINDFYGVEAGDLILCEIAKVIEYFSKEKGVYFYRIYSDVYAVTCKEETSTEEFINILSEIQSIINEQCFFYKRHRIYIGTTIGVAIDDNQIMEKADMALNYGKRHKKNFQIYDDNLFEREKYERNLIWSKKISDAIKDDRIVPFFQPIYNNKTGNIEKYEALIRMIDEDNSIISPYKFLDASIKSRLYSELTKIMINKTFKVFEHREYEFSINLLLDDIQNEEIRELIFEKLRNFKKPKNVVFEIVESQGIDKFKLVKDFIDDIHSFGAKIAIDDFGTGYSNFKYLVELNVDFIKIDGSIIKNIYKDRASEVVAETVVDFSTKLGIRTIAEFVHNKEVYDKVKNLNIDFSQGYYISQPVPKII